MDEGRTKEGFDQGYALVVGVGADLPNTVDDAVSLALHAREVVPGRTGDRQHPILHFEQADNFVLAYYAGGETQPKGLPFAGEPEIEPEPGAWAGLDQRRPMLSITGDVSGGQVRVAVGGPPSIPSTRREEVTQTSGGSNQAMEAREAICSSCGHRLRPDARFCSRWGAPVGSR
jgi:hypothetical protein